MNCSESNRFCESFPPDIRAQLCAHCHLHTYRRDSYLTFSEIDTTVCVLVSGFTLMMSPTTENKWVNMCMAGPGELLVEGGLLIGRRIDLNSNSHILPLTDCTLASFDRDFIDHMLQTDITFVRTIYRHALYYYTTESMQMLYESGFNDAYSAVRHVIAYCRKCGHFNLTHEQIALACNRNRTTVTKAIHQLLQNEPELFSDSPSSDN